ncbi:hypothetical protein T02_7380 [Trichinella nativa]|uniref:Uncharacterized protein n=1 Tax=Trichinella nativa TaxID=6335 RepID=A0A0V1KLH2_9BILA|nr:hypothetical protein T02_7380 [Trichinella nativa]
MEIWGGEVGEAVINSQVGQIKRVIVTDITTYTEICSFPKNRSRIAKPWKASAFMATTGKLYLLIRLNFLLC